jgi:hypothetical protein
MQLDGELAKLAQEAVPTRVSDAYAQGLQGFLTDALPACNGEVEAISYGSLARGTHVDPIRDVDVLLIVEPRAELGWIHESADPRQVLDRLRQEVAVATGSTIWRGSTILGNHSVKHFPEVQGRTQAAPFADVVPALRTSAESLLIPDVPSASWIETNPKVLADRVRERQAEWGDFISVVRLLKAWNLANGAPVKSLAVEVLAIELLAPGPLSQAVPGFFSAACARSSKPVIDPAGLCGEIDPLGDFSRLEERLRAAAEDTGRALRATGAGEAGTIAKHALAGSLAA